MSDNTELSLIPMEHIAGRIYVIRGVKVMLDRDLAELYGVETRTLNQAVRRNIDRFPEDFMFQLTSEEMENWISQFVISNREKMGLRRPPLAFTEQGVAMLSSVLRSKRAIQVNIQIMRTFTQLRKILASNKELWRKIEEIEERQEFHDRQFQAVFDIIADMLKDDDKPKKLAGFNRENKNTS